MASITLDSVSQTKLGVNVQFSVVNPSQLSYMKVILNDESTANGVISREIVNSYTTSQNVLVENSKFTPGDTYKITIVGCTNSGAGLQSNIEDLVTLPLIGKPTIDSLAPGDKQIKATVNSTFNDTIYNLDPSANLVFVYSTFHTGTGITQNFLQQTAVMAVTASNEYTFDVTYNNDIYEVTCYVLQGSLTSEISDTLTVTPVNLANHAQVSQDGNSNFLQAIEDNGDNARQQIRTTVELRDDYSNPHDSYDTVRFNVYNKNQDTYTKIEHFDLSTNIFDNNGTHDIITNITLNDIYDLHFTTQNMTSTLTGADGESDHFSSGFQWNTFHVQNFIDSTPNSLTNTTTLVGDECQLDLSWSGVSDADLANINLNFVKYEVKLFQKKTAPDSDVLLETVDISNNNTVDHSFNMNQFDIGGEEAFTTIVLHYTTKYAQGVLQYTTEEVSSSNVNVFNLSKLASINYDYVRTEGINVDISLSSTYSHEGFVPNRYNIFLVFKSDVNDPFEYIVSKDTDEAGTPPNNTLNSIALHSAVGDNASVFKSFTPSMNDIYTNTNNQVSSTESINYLNFNEPDSYGKYYTFQVRTLYQYDNGAKQYERVDDLQLDSDGNDSSEYVVQVFDSTPEYGGVTSFDSVQDTQFTLYWPTIAEQPGLSFRRYIVNLFQEGILVDTSGNEDENNADNFFDDRSNNTTTTFTNLSTGNRYDTEVYAEFTPIDDNFPQDNVQYYITNHLTTASNIFTNAVSIQGVTHLFPTSASITGLDNDTDQTNNIVKVDWVNPSQSDLNNTADSKGYTYTNTVVTLKDATNNQPIATVSISQSDATTHNFTSIAYNGNTGYYVAVNYVFTPKTTGANVSGSASQSSTKILYKGDVSTLAVNQANTIALTQFKNVDDSGVLKNEVKVDWTITNTVSSTPLDFVTDLESKGLNFKHYEVTLVDLNTGGTNTQVTTTTEGSSQIFTHTFSNVPFNGTHGYKASIQIVAEPIDNSDAVTYIGSNGTNFKGTSVESGVKVLYVENISDATSQTLTNVTIDNFENSGEQNNVNVSWELDEGTLNTELAAKGLKFKNYVLNLIDKNSDNNNTNGQTDTNVVDSSFTDHTFSNVPFSNDGYQFSVQFVVEPYDNSALTNVGESLIHNSSTVNNGVTKILYGQVVSAFENVSAINIVDFINVANNQHNIKTQWALTNATLTTEMNNKGLKFKNFTVNLVDQTAGGNKSVSHTGITTIETIVHEFNNVQFNNNGYKASIQYELEPIDSVPLTYLNGGVNHVRNEVTSNTAFVPFDTNLQNETDENDALAPQNVEIASFSNAEDVNNGNILKNTVNVSWNKVEQDTLLNNNGLRFKHYVVTLASADSNNFSHTITTTYSDKTENTHIFNNVPFDNAGYTCSVHVVVEPLQSSPSTFMTVTNYNNIEHNGKVGISSSFIFYKKDISNDADFNVKTTDIVSFENDLTKATSDDGFGGSTIEQSLLQNIDNTLSLEWSMDASLSSNLSALGLQFDKYTLNILDASSNEVLVTPITTTVTSVNTFSATMDVPFSDNAHGYKFEVHPSYVPIQSGTGVEHNSVNHRLISVETINPYLTDISNYDTFKSNSISITVGDFVNVDDDGTLKNDIKYSWNDSYQKLDNQLSQLGYELSKYELKLIDLDNSSIINTYYANFDQNDVVSNHTFTNVPFNTSGYKVELREVYQPYENGDYNSTSVSLITSDLVQHSGFIPYRKSINVEDLVVVHTLPEDHQLNASWNAAIDYTSQGLTLSEYEIELYETNVKVTTDPVILRVSSTTTQYLYDTSTTPISPTKSTHVNVKAIYETTWTGDSLEVSSDTFFDNSGKAIRLKKTDALSLSTYTQTLTNITDNDFDVTCNWTYPTFSNDGMNFVSIEVSLHKHEWNGTASIETQLGDAFTTSDVNLVTKLFDNVSYNDKQLFFTKTKVTFKDDKDTEHVENSTSALFVPKTADGLVETNNTLQLTTAEEEGDHAHKQVQSVFTNTATLPPDTYGMYEMQRIETTFVAGGDVFTSNVTTATNFAETQLVDYGLTIDASADVFYQISSSIKALATSLSNTDVRVVVNGAVVENVTGENLNDHSSEISLTYNGSTSFKLLGTPEITTDLTTLHVFPKGDTVNNLTLEIRSTQLNGDASALSYGEVSHTYNNFNLFTSSNNGAQLSIPVDVILNNFPWKNAESLSGVWFIGWRASFVGGDDVEDEYVGGYSLTLNGVSVNSTGI